MSSKYTVAYDTDVQVLRRLAKINIVVCTNSEQVTELIQSLLGEIGFSNTRITNNVFDAVKHLKTEEIHLLVIDSELRVPSKDHILDNEVLEDAEMQSLCGYSFVYRVRHARRSPNRYIPILMLLDEKDADQVTKARDSGVTEILPHPLEAKQLFKQMSNIIDKPRIFVTADTYKGPCRRLKKGGKPPEGIEERRKLDIRVIEYRKEKVIPYE